MTEIKSKLLLHLVMGEIGGAGKSWFAKILIEAYISLFKDYIVVDADESTPNVGITYDPNNYSPVKIQEYNDKLAKAELELLPLIKAVSTARLDIKVTADKLKQSQVEHAANPVKEQEDALKIAKESSKKALEKLANVEKTLEAARKKNAVIPLQKRIHFSADRPEDRELPNEILDWMLEQEKDAIVNLPAQVGKAVNNWIRSSGLIEEEMLSEGIGTICWFVGKPTNQSIEQLIALKEFHGDKLKVVLVKNLYENHAGSWSDVLTQTILDRLESMNISSINLPHMGITLEQRIVIDSNYVTFSDLASDKDTNFKHLMKGRTRMYLKQAIAEITATGLLPVAKVGVSNNKEAE
jgi:hypothetical protein